MATPRMPPTDLLDHLASADVDGLHTILQHALQQLIEAEATAYIGAEPGEHSDSRTTYRTGHRARTLDTRVGRLDLPIPKVRTGSFLPSLLEPRRRIERALLAVIQEAYGHGVSTRKVDDVAAGLVAKPSVDCNGGTMAISPGIYPSIETSHACLLTFMPGNYILGDLTLDYSFVTIGSLSTNTTIVLTHGMSIGTGAAVTGTNALFYNSCTEYVTRLPGGCRTGDAFGGLQFSGGIDFGAVTPQVSGPYQNLTFFQDTGNPKQ